MSHSEVIEILGRSRTLARAERDCSYGTELAGMVERLATEVLALQGEVDRVQTGNEKRWPGWMEEVFDDKPQP